MERNYAEDQANEVEALESIYCDDIESKKSALEQPTHLIECLSF